MFSSKKVESEGYSTLIAQGIKLEGAKLSGIGMVRIDGSFIGDVDIDGEIILGESGEFEGTITAKNALIAGRMTGDVHVAETTHLDTTAVVAGNIETDKLVVDEGACFSGHSKMGKGDNVAYIDQSMDKTV